MKVLFLDLATATGWAVDDATGQAPLTGLATLPGAVGDRVGHTLACYHTWLRLAIAYHMPDLVGYEAPLLLPRKSNFVLICLVGVTQLVCHQEGIPCDGTLTASGMKKRFTGDGHAKKRAVIARCRRWGWDVGDDDNRADAAAGWAVLKAAREPGWTVPIPPLRELAP